VQIIAKKQNPPQQQHPTTTTNNNKTTTPKSFNTTSLELEYTSSSTNMIKGAKSISPPVHRRE
jgi:hypothetical protein